MESGTPPHGQGCDPNGAAVGGSTGPEHPQKGSGGGLQGGRIPMRVLQGRGTPLGNGGVSIGDPTGQWGDSLWGQGSGSPHGGPTGQRQPPSGETGPPTPGLSPPLTLAAAPAAAVLALAGPGTGAGVTWGGRAAVSRGTGRDGTGTAGTGHLPAAHVQSWGSMVWLGLVPLASARLGSQQYGGAPTARYL